MAIDDCAPVRTHFHAILEGCNFLRLKSLRLDGVPAKPEQLLQFLRSHNSLLDVAYHHYCLGHENWELLLQGCRTTTRLRVLKLDYLDFIEVARQESYIYTTGRYRNCKTFVREDGSSLLVYGL